MSEEEVSQPPVSYLDRPAPSAVLLFFMLAALGSCALAFSLFVYLWSLLSNPVYLLALACLLGLTVTTLVFFWAVVGTRYRLGPDGIHVKYGPWKRLHPWADFQRASRRAGLFSPRIGSPSVAPCVRFTDAVVFERKRGLPLYVTPRDSQEFLRKVGEFAKELTS